mgnify:CR=1 FL=1
MRELTAEDTQELNVLNNAVFAALSERQEWLDAKMAEYADVPVGGRLYDLSTGQCVGIVVRHYRFWRDRDDGVRDTSLNIQYEYRTNGGYIQNTSSQIERTFGSEGQIVQ